MIIADYGNPILPASLSSQVKQAGNSLRKFHELRECTPRALPSFRLVGGGK